MYPVGPWHWGNIIPVLMQCVTLYQHWLDCINIIQVLAGYILLVYIYFFLFQLPYFINTEQTNSCNRGDRVGQLQQRRCVWMICYMMAAIQKLCHDNLPLLINLSTDNPQYNGSICSLRCYRWQESHSMMVIKYLLFLIYFIKHRLWYLLESSC